MEIALIIFLCVMIVGIGILIGNSIWVGFPNDKFDKMPLVIILYVIGGVLMVVAIMSSLTILLERRF